MMMTVALALVLMAGDQPTASGAKDKLRCRSEPVIGSLSRRIKNCHTAAEWQALDDAANKTGRQMIDQGLQSCADCRRG